MGLQEEMHNGKDGYVQMRVAKLDYGYDVDKLKLGLALIYSRRSFFALSGTLIQVSNFNKNPSFGI